MATYITKCGLFFRVNTGGSGHYLGESWGEDYGKDTVRCPKPEKSECVHCKNFQSRFGTIVGDCEGVLVSEEKYIYAHSLEKIIQEYSKQSYEKVIQKFGCYCSAIRADGKGGYEVRRDEMSCHGCWERICVVTNKERDLTKVRLMGDIETVWTETRGFLVEEHKNLVRKRVLKELVPLEFAERLLKNSNNTIFGGFILNNCERLAQQLGLEPKSRVLRFYYEKSTAKRNFLDDLRAVAEGYTVIHDIDTEKTKKEVKRKKKEERELRKKQNLKLKKKLKSIKQISLWD